MVGCGTARTRRGARGTSPREDREASSLSSQSSAFEVAFRHGSKLQLVHDNDGHPAELLGRLLLRRAMGNGVDLAEPGTELAARVVRPVHVELHRAPRSWDRFERWDGLSPFPQLSSLRARDTYMWLFSAQVSQ